MSGTAIATIGPTQWEVYLATTFEELIQGLGGLIGIPPQTGMLFDLGFDQVITVTTVPMFFPLDIVFISSGGRVVDIARNVPPGVLVTSGEVARYFLEVNAGEAAGVQTGAEVHVQISGHVLAFPDPPIGIPPMPPLPRAPMSPIFELGMAGMMMLFAGNMARSMIGDAFVPPEKEKELPPERKLLPPGRLPQTERLWVEEELPFAAAREDKLWWLATIRDKLYQVEVRRIRGLTMLQLENAFADSTAKISVPHEEREPERELPFAAVGRPTGLRFRRSIWWLATIEGKTHQVEVTNIRGLKERQIEDAFTDSLALVSIPTQKWLPQTEHPVPERGRIATISLRGGMYIGEIKDEFGLVESVTVARTVEEVKKWAKEHGVTDLHIEGSKGSNPPAKIEDREEKLEDKWFQRGVEAGKTDGWMTVEETLAETLERHRRPGLDPHELVWLDIDEWETTGHFHVFYGSKMMEDAGRDLDLFSELKAKFWEGFLIGRKKIGIDIHKIAAELVKSPPVPGRGRIEGSKGSNPRAGIKVAGSFFVGACRVEGRLCHTHGLFADERVRCPKSPLTHDEWKAVYRLVQAALDKGDHQIIGLWASTVPEKEIIYGKWPATLQSALETVRKYELSLQRAIEKYAAGMEASIDHFRRSAERAVMHYRDYVMRLYAERVRDAEEIVEKHPQTIPNKPRPTRYDVAVESWMERDRLGIWITDNRTDETIAEWWDNEARELFEQGFFRPGVPERALERPGREFIDSVLDFAEATGLLARGNPRGEKEIKTKVIRYHPPPRGQAGVKFMADGQHHLTQTIAAIGYRTQIDNAFQEAIARAKGTLRS